MAVINNLAQTWNSGGTTYSGIRLNVTDAASAAASKLLDLLVGGSSRFSVRKDGLVTTAGGLSVAGASALAAVTATSLALTTDLPLTEGGTGASSAVGARTNLGLGSMATQAASAVAITGGTIAGITDLAVADGGTGASTAAGARTALDVPGLGEANVFTNSGNRFASILQVRSSNVGAGGAYVELRDSAGTRLGYIGHGSTGNAHLTINAEAAGANVQLSPGSGGVVAALAPFEGTFGTFTSSGVPLTLNSTNSNAPKIALQDNGVVRGYFGATSSGPAVFNSSASSIAQFGSSGSLALVGALNVGDFISTGATSGVNVTTAGRINSSVTSASTTTHYAFYNSNGNVGTITTNGSATTYGTSSDYRLKQDVEALVDFDFSGFDLTALPEAAQRVIDMRPVRFRFIADPSGPLVHGFIAHELEEVVPEAVAGDKDAVEERGTITIPAVVENGEEIMPEEIWLDRLEEETPEGATWQKTSEQIRSQNVDPSKLVADLVATVQMLVHMSLNHEQRLAA